MIQSLISEMVPLKSYFQSLLVPYGKRRKKLSEVSAQSLSSLVHPKRDIVPPSALAMHLIHKFTFCPRHMVWQWAACSRKHVIRLPDQGMSKIPHLRGCQCEKRNTVQAGHSPVRLRSPPPLRWQLPSTVPASAQLPHNSCFRSDNLIQTFLYVFYTFFSWHFPGEHVRSWRLFTYLVLYSWWSFEKSWRGSLSVCEWVTTIRWCGRAWEETAGQRMLLLLSSLESLDFLLSWLGYIPGTRTFHSLNWM